MFVTPDDFLALRDRIAASPPFGNDYAVEVFDRLVAQLEPQLVITEPGGAADWHAAVVVARRAIRLAQHGTTPHLLNRVADLASKFAPVSGALPVRSLPFISAKDLRSVAEADWSRVVAAGAREEAKTVAIAAGSVVEAAALDVLERLEAADVASLREHLNATRETRPPLKGSPSDWKFAGLLRGIGPGGIQVLSSRTFAIGDRLRDWRNLVHPEVSRSEAPLTAADGRLAAGLAEKVLEEVEAWHTAGAVVRLPGKPG